MGRTKFFKGEFFLAKGKKGKRQKRTTTGDVVTTDTTGNVETTTTGNVRRRTTPILRPLAITVPLVCGTANNVLIPNTTPPFSSILGTLSNTGPCTAVVTFTRAEGENLVINVPPAATVVVQNGEGPFTSAVVACNPVGAATGGCTIITNLTFIQNV